MALKPVGAGEEPLPKSFTLAAKGKPSAPKFLIIGPAGSRDGFPKNLIVGGKPGLPPHRHDGFHGVFSIPKKGRGGVMRFPQILHTCVCPGRQKAELCDQSSPLQARDDKVWFPQNPHTWRSSNDEEASLRPVFPASAAS